MSNSTQHSNVYFYLKQKVLILFAHLKLTEMSEEILIAHFTDEVTE